LEALSLGSEDLVGSAMFVCYMLFFSELVARSLRLVILGNFVIG
jgi:hypothetical protein